MAIGVTTKPYVAAVALAAVALAAVALVEAPPVEALVVAHALAQTAAAHTTPMRKTRIVISASCPVVMAARSVSRHAPREQAAGE
jgi:hypothetical protein